jgi:ABC-type transport system involved in multi-copper enzyme maturation permease subunit
MEVREPLDRARRRKIKAVRSKEEPPLFNGPLLGPVTRKEISGFSRRWQTYLGRVIYVALVGLVLAQFRSRLLQEGGLTSISEYAHLSRDIFSGFVAVQFVFVTLLSLTSAADLLGREIRSGTIQLLLLAPISLHRIVFEKWKAALVQSASLVFCGLPIVAICVYLGGIGMEELAWSVCLTLASAAMGSAFALRYSATQATGTRAVLAGATALVVSALLPFLVCFVLGPYMLYVTPFLHPFHAAVAAAVSQPGDTVRYGWILATPIALLFSIRTVRKAAWKTEDRLKATPKPYQLRGDRLDLQIFTSRVPWLPSLKLTGGVWEDRPLLWKELATRPAARVSTDLKQMMWIYYLLFMILAFGMTEGRSLGTFVLLGSAFVFMSAISGASLFAPDKEGRKLDLLRSTPLSDWQIVRAKLAAGLLSPEAFMGIVLWVLLVGGWSWWAGPGGMLAYAIISGVYLLFAYLLGAAASLRARTLRGAFLFSVALQTILLGGLPFAVTLLRDLSSTGKLPIGNGLLEFIHPAFLLHSFGDSRHPFPQLIPYVTIYAIAGALLVALMIRDFRRVDDSPRG